MSNSSKAFSPLGRRLDEGLASKSHPLTPPSPPGGEGKHCNGWSAERRAKHRAAIQKWKPWARSTGPRTAEGKSRSAMNAKTHGRRSAACRRFDSLLRFHRQWLRLLRENRRENICSANELLEILRRGVVNSSLYGKKDFILPNPAWLMVYSGLREP